MSKRERPNTEFIPIAVSAPEAPVAQPAAPPAPAEAAPPASQPTPPAATPPSDQPFAGRRASQKTTQWRAQQSKFSGAMLALVALFVILLIVAAAYLVFVSLG